ncbi:MAG TPA: hypothetical protein DIC51_05285 [Coxiellaceae bacterium]|nr:hypothetical protein [Coxiellaceae bacterium]
MPISILSSRFLMWAQADDQFKLYVDNGDVANCLDSMPFCLLTFSNEKKRHLLSDGYLSLLDNLKAALSIQKVHELLKGYARQLVVVVDDVLKIHGNLIVEVINGCRQEKGKLPINWSHIKAKISRGCLLRALSFLHVERANNVSDSLMDHLEKLNNGTPVDIHSQLSKLVTALFQQERIVNKSRPDVDNPGRYMRF